jgi:hypothetical protein
MATLGTLTATHWWKRLETEISLSQPLEMTGPRGRSFCPEATSQHLERAEKVGNRYRYSSMPIRKVSSVLDTFFLGDRAGRSATA